MTAAVRLRVHRSNYHENAYLGHNPTKAHRKESNTHGRVYSKHLYSRQSVGAYFATPDKIILTPTLTLHVKYNSTSLRSTWTTLG